MTEFFNILPPDEALATLFQHLPTTQSTPTSILATEDALDAVTDTPVLAPSDLPAFPRSTMDGYAVQANDTFGASQTMPAYLTVVGNIAMGHIPQFDIGPTQAALVHTGGMIPESADAVVMIENTQHSHQSEIEVTQPVSVGENLLKVGEDVREASQMIPAGQRLRPQDIGALMSLGITSVRVANAPKIGIIATGDELQEPDSGVAPGQVRDINSYTVSALVERSGGIPVRYGIVPDEEDALEETLIRALTECHAAVISAGSSVSVRDITAEVIGRLGHPGVLVHGVAIKPGKPTILAVSKGKPVFGLPGNPVSALITADMFLVPTIYHLQGTNAPQPRIVTARLTHNVASTAGREDYVPGRFVPPPTITPGTEAETSQGNWVEPVFGKSNLIFTLVRADGVIVVPLNSNGLTSGTRADVRLF